MCEAVAMNCRVRRHFPIFTDCCVAIIQKRDTERVQDRIPDAKAGSVYSNDDCYMPYWKGPCTALQVMIGLRKSDCISRTVRSSLQAP